jgi:hypothetical protein
VLGKMCAHISVEALPRAWKNACSRGGPSQKSETGLPLKFDPLKKEPQKYNNDERSVLVSLNRCDGKDSNQTIQVLIQTYFSFVEVGVIFYSVWMMCSSEFMKRRKK